jgi:hypothetical protein
VGSCRCRCHGVERADHREALHEGTDWARVFSLARDARYAVPAVESDTDPVAAVFACAQCVNGHCDVLLIRVIWAPEPYSTPEPAPFTADETQD